MILKNGMVFCDDFKFRKQDIEIENGVITKLADKIDGKGSDISGQYVIPGLVDIHTHGCGGSDACDGDMNALNVISRTQAKAGVTSFCATSMTVPREQIAKVFETVKQFRSDRAVGAKIIGINMEGPFFAESKKGAQRADCLKNPDVKFFRELNKISGDAVRLVDLAPELDGAMEFIDEISKEVVVSIGHTACNYQIAMDAIKSGATHVTHLFNAMNGFTHRESGVVGAASDSDNVYTEIICDGIHISAPVIRAAFKLMNDRVCLISDSMSACGMPNGEYELGGQKVIMKDRKATLVDGTIAGSATNLFDCMKKAVEFNIPLETAVKAATYNPAKSINMENEVGVIKQGRTADLVICDKDLNKTMVIIDGEEYKA